MFVPEKAFEHLDGQVFSISQLYNELAEVRFKHSFPAETELEDLMDILHKRKWLVEENGRVRVQIKVKQFSGVLR